MTTRLNAGATATATNATLRRDDVRANRCLNGNYPVALEPLTVRIPTAMKLTGIGRSKLYELIASGDIEIVKVGTATLVTMGSLRRLVERGTE